MPDALWAAATGMLAQQTAMDATANNLSNVNTTGFKRGRTAFQDLLYQELTPQQAAKQGSQVGVGTRVGGVQTEFEQGAFQKTGNPLDVAIEGDGFFSVIRADGSQGYTRDGSFTTNAKGQLVTQSGDLVQPAITIPANGKDTAISANGTVSANVDGRVQRLGQVQVATFTNPYGLASAGGNLYTATASSGQARAGGAGAGQIRQGVLEGSNVDSVDEMVGMINTQRAYEAVSKVVSASDEMLGMANSLRRG